MPWQITLVSLLTHTFAVELIARWADLPSNKDPERATTERKNAMLLYS